jgi:hypothetical protein
MNTQTVRLCAAIDQARAELRDRIAEATVAIGPQAAREADQVVADYFVPVLRQALEGDDLAGRVDPCMAEFLRIAGVIMWATLEVERIEGQDVDFD